MTAYPLSTIEKVIDTIVKRWSGEENYSRDKRMAQLGLDELSHIEIIMAIEEHFGIDVDDASVEVMYTPQMMICHVYEEFNV